MALHTVVRGRGRGPRVVLVHGFTQTSQSWAPVADALADDYEVVLVDAPGHGGSSAVRAALDEAAALVGEAGRTAAYVGYSMGGRMCLHLALAQPGLVRRLVLVGATAGIEDDAGRAQRRGTDEALAQSILDDGVAAFLDRWLAQPLFAGLRPDAADLAARLANDPGGLASSLHLAGTGAQAPQWARLAELSMPVLLVAGTRDEKFAAIAHRMQAAIGGNAAVALVPEAGHAAHLERPDAFLCVLRPFLAG